MESSECIKTTCRCCGHDNYHLVPTIEEGIDMLGKCENCGVAYVYSFEIERIVHVSVSTVTAPHKERQKSNQANISFNMADFTNKLLAGPWGTT